MIHRNDVSLVSGKYFDWSNIASNTHLKIIDVASGLASTGRYCGQIPGGVYNVAHHSILVSKLLAEKYPMDYQLQFDGLMHDATEALMGDITSPLKKLLPDYRRIESELAYFMGMWFGFDPRHDDRVRHADLLALAIEKLTLLGNNDHWGCLEDVGITTASLAFHLPRPISEYLSEPMSHSDSRNAFLIRYNELVMRGGQRVHLSNPA
ncbi:hypothetical protein PJWF_00053 [Achromobacter phage JWF]|uniref:deoxyribonucleoside 5' monophosphate phosphatase n=1 Tax=Achromobacter phage JWF TaxID=1589748 RepID=UPI000588DF56|nr:deoxyribonucleoside 5' monophosphate phosphatase [Achromobacter phage JWF]AJD82947.1 hypothetical protein PJWF_00053 [Achromobacter phage JWF]